MKCGLTAVKLERLVSDEAPFEMVLLAQYIGAHSTPARDPRLNGRTAVWLVVHFQQSLLKVKIDG